MLSFCRARRQSVAVPAVSRNSSHAACAQASGMARLATMSTLRRTVSLPSFGQSGLLRTTVPSSGSYPATPAESAVPSPSRLTEAEELAQDRRTVKREFEQYLADGLISDSAGLNLVQYWDVSIVNSDLQKGCSSRL